MIVDFPEDRRIMKVESVTMEEPLPKNIGLRRRSWSELGLVTESRLERTTPERISELIKQGYEGLAEKIAIDWFSIDKGEWALVEALIINSNRLEDWKRVEWCNEILEINPTNKIALDILVQSYSSRGDFARSLEIAEILLEEDNENKTCLDLMVSKGIMEKDWADVIKWSRRLLELDNNNHDACRSMAVALSATNDSEAIEFWGRFAESPNIGDSDRFKVSRRFYNVGNYSRAIALLTDIGQKELRVLELLARSHYSLGNWEEAYKTCSDLLIESPENLTALRLRMRSLRNLDDKTGARISAEKLLESERGDIEALRTMIQSSASLEDWEEVGELAKIAIENDSLKYEAARWQARSLSRLNDPEAWIAWGNLLQLVGPDVEALVELGRHHYRKLEDDLANSMFEEAIRIDPESTKVTRYLASSRLRLGLLEESIPLLEKLSSDDVNSVKNWERLIETFLRMEDKAQANETWGNLVSSSWDSFESFITSLEVSLRFHWKDRFQWLLETRGPLFQTREDYNRRLGKVFLNIGDIATCWGYLKKAKDFKNTDVFREISRILEITGSSIGEIEEFESRGKSLWIATLAVKTIIENSDDGHNIRRGRRKVSLVSSTLNKGGAERQISYTFRGLNRKKFDCELLVRRFDGRGKGNTFLDLIDNIDGSKVEVGKIPLDEVEMVFDGFEVDPEVINLLPLGTAEMVKRLVHQFNIEGPDLVHAWQDETILSASIAALICRVPRVLCSARSMRPDEKSELHIRKRPHIGQCIGHLIGMDRISLTANSSAGKESYAEWLEIEKSKIGVIHNGVDFEMMEGQGDSGVVRSRMRDFGFRDGHVVIGGVFRLEPGKRVDLWLKTFEECLKFDDSLRGVIVGGGRMERALKRWVEEKGLKRRVLLTGFEEDVASWLNEMDVFLLTSRTEGLPNVLIEAQGFGVPVVTTDAGGAREVVENNSTGVVVESSDPVDLSLAVAMSIENRENWSRNARSRSRKKFSIKGMIDSTEAIYSEILSA